MPAYVVVDIQISDPDLYNEYKALAPAIVALYGGKYLARGHYRISGLRRCYGMDRLTRIRTREKASPSGSRLEHGCGRGGLTRQVIITQCI